MVLEALINPKQATGRPWEMYFIGLLYCLLAVGLSYWVFRSHVSIVMVSMTAIATIPFIYAAVQSEEEKSTEKEKNNWLQNVSLLRTHAKIVSIFLFLFLGFVTVYFTLFVFLPAEALPQLFQAQIEAISAANGPTGNFFSVWGTFSKIIFNNMRILFLCVLFSFFYGVGAMFVLSWNASVMGVAIGDAIRQGLADVTNSTFQVVSTSLVGYFIHGLPEMISFFIGGLAGGIIFMALIREGLHSEKFMGAGRDALNLLCFAAVLLFFAALIEVFVSSNIL